MNKRGKNIHFVELFIRGSEGMLYTYTPETVGGTIIVDFPTGKYHSQELFYGEDFVSIRERENDGLIIIQVQERRRNKMVISNVELEFKKHPTDNYHFPILEKA
jgi:hypothetical protein